MSEFKRAALHDFAHMHEKSPPPIFVGRKDVLNDVLAIAKKTKKNRAGIPGNTTFIQGAPGAGKSSILSHIQNILRKGGDDIPNAGILILNSEDIHSPADILRPLAYQVSQEQAATFLTKEQKTQSFSAKGKLLVAKVEGNIETTVEQSPDEATLAAFKQWITRQDLTESFAHRPIIIAIDEAQAFECTKGHAISKLFRGIHNASQALPLTLVFAGLGDTHSVITDMGITHGVAPYSLGCFTTEEIDTLTTGWCAHFGIGIGDQRARIDALMTSTDGWPRHVHWAQRALAEALLQEDVNGQADRIPDWGAVQSHADTLRCGYYKTQYSKHMNYDPRLTAKVLFDVAMAEQTQDCLSSAQLRKNIKSYCEQHETSDFECPPDMTYADFITHLIHCGALRETDDGTTLTCPIPSFQSYIIERGGLEIPFVRPLESSIET